MCFLIILSSFLLLLLIEGSYFLWIREYVLNYFEGNTPIWFSDLAEQLYPRLKTEKHRFETKFFISKTDQIAFRFAYVYVIGIVCVFLKKNFSLLRASLFLKHDQKYILIVYFFIANILLSLQWKDILIQYTQIASLYEPISFYTFVSPIFPSVRKIELYFLFFNAINGLGIIFSILFLTYSFLKLAIPTKVTHIFKGVHLLLLLSSATLFIYIQGFLYGFGKTEHTYATWNWVCITLPLWYIQTWSDKKYYHQNYLLIVAVALIYCFSGLEKIFIGGVEWLNGNALVSYLQRSPNTLGQSLANYPLLTWLGSLIVVFWEIGFITLLFSKKWMNWILIGLGICFHVGTYFLLGVGHFLSPWIWVYVFLMIGKKHASNFEY